MVTVDYESEGREFESLNPSERSDFLWYSQFSFTLGLSRFFWCPFCSRFWTVVVSNP